MMPSSVIRDFAYDPDAHALAIRFISGRRYVYRDVPPDVAEGLRVAFSKGEYFNAAVRDRYLFERRR